MRYGGSPLRYLGSVWRPFPVSVDLKALGGGTVRTRHHMVTRSRDLSPYFGNPVLGVKACGRGQRGAAEGCCGKPNKA